MARIGDVLEGGGKRLVFRETKADTNGARLAFDEFVEAGVSAVPAHLHPQQRERFTVVAGTLGLQVNGEQRLLQGGESLDVPAGTAHTYWNAGEGELHHIVTLEPALDHDRFFESVYGLTAEGFTPDKKTFRNLLLAAGLFARHENWMVGVPVTVQKLVFPLLAALGHRLGLRVWKPEYAARQRSVPLDVPTTA
ncbi:cupin domain-containing protein [Deinococcus sp. Arct2-2]|uniref:cupin domain-containing protein n=1 Tax=Deinococcus sp. Arct2-2 TaxID=2568653 RepID=UPI0010A512E1|nr:cupin domain-containing protein [Deinococcus sp. Arct2-2]THF66727.1 cupin domain-containing protein [Deinococcus sp. Arct2-2]